MELEVAHGQLAGVERLGEQPAGVSRAPFGQGEVRRQAAYVKAHRWICVGMLAYELFATADIMPGLGLAPEQQENLAEVHFCLGQEKGIAQSLSGTVPLAESGKGLRIAFLIIEAVAQRQIVVEHLILRH